MHNSGASRRGAAKLCLKTTTLFEIRIQATHCGFFAREAGSATRTGLTAMPGAGLTIL